MRCGRLAVPLLSKITHSSLPPMCFPYGPRVLQGDYTRWNGDADSLPPADYVTHLESSMGGNSKPDYRDTNMANLRVKNKPRAPKHIPNAGIQKSCITVKTKTKLNKNKTRPASDKSPSRSSYCTLRVDPPKIGTVWMACMSSHTPREPIGWQNHLYSQASQSSKVYPGTTM